MTETHSPYSTLRTAAAKDWEAAVTHRFVGELVDETIPPTVLRDYLIQDYQFAEDFLSLLGRALTTADRISSKMRLAHQLGVIADDEDTYFQERFEQYGVQAEKLAHPELTPSSTGFRKLYRDVTEHGTYAETLAVLVVAEGLYLDWAERGTTHGTRMPKQREHRGWVEVHRGDAFAAWVDFLVSELNRVVDQVTPGLTELFTRAVKLELGFFEDAYRDAA
ncbi:MAG: TenA family protein [Microbacteriaceae bacterium]|jgi:thiaminase/transcriptional activator TenA|nr:TenA family protein [Microbacteriaceae bacterium]MCI1206812.1 TenA family protein [Microbacteriaceae bacterium]